MNEEGKDEYGCEYCEGGGKLDHNDCCPQCGALFLDEDNNDIDEYFQEICQEAAEKERAKIVAWLHIGHEFDANWGIYFANCIEAGEHLK